MSNFKGQHEAGLWFRTHGCTHDIRGGCVMCDYSIGGETSSEDMVRYVKNGLKSINHRCNHLLVSPSGSMLDNNEVPKQALEEILISLGNTEHNFFSFETRADTISGESMSICKNILNERFYRLFVGLECANNGVLKYCLNKQMTTHEYSSSVKIAVEKRVVIAANIILGIPFLSENESIQMAVDSVKWAIKSGVKQCFLFPTHVKSDTLLHVLYMEQLYTPVSLWSLIECIKRLGASYYEYIRLSWYTSYGAYNIAASPQTCSKCYDEVISCLDKFSSNPECEYVERLLALNCDCKDTWQKCIENNAKNKSSLLANVRFGYGHLAKMFMLDEKADLDNLFNEMESDFNQDTHILGELNDV
jgi:hypothetical protein